jgi:Tol biopolymer transport system component
LCALWLAAAALAHPQQQPEAMLRAGMHKETVEGDLPGAIELYKKVAQSANRAVAAQALVRMGQCYEKLGDTQAQEARKAYQRVVRDFADQAEIVAQARVRLAALGGPGAAGGLVARRVLTDASDEMLTPDGKYLSHIDEGTGDLVQFDVASGQTSRITNRGPWRKEEYEGEAAFSRDGKQIAYVSYTKDWVPQLRIRNLDGSGLRTLYSEKGSYAYPMDWSPDAGSILAEFWRNQTCELTLVSTADGSVRVLRTFAIVWVRVAHFSPDGRFIAFTSVREGSPPNIDVSLMTADGRNEVVVAGHPAEDHLLRWTPDGRSIVFLSDRSGTWDIWSVHITGGKQQGEPELLKKDFGYHPWGNHGFAPDGSLYYDTVTPDLGGLYNGEIDLETGKVLVPPAPVTTRHTGPPSELTWSPDGRNLAYISRYAPGSTARPGNNILTIRSAATGEERLLLTVGHVHQISWAPDGRSVIALTGKSGRNGIFRIDTETSKSTKLADKDRFLPRLCPDGKTLVFVVAGGTAGRIIIKKRNLDTGEESEVVKTSGPYDLSPDGRELVFHVDGAVKTVSLNGGEPRELFRGLAKYYRLKWTRDGRYIIAQGAELGGSGTIGTGEIWRVPAQGGTPLKLNLAVPYLDYFALNPDNRRFALSVNGGTKREVWVLENFLPKLKTSK